MACDQRLPACSECVRAGWLCPGYDRRWKFVDENKQLVRRYSENGYHNSGRSESPDAQSGVSVHGLYKPGDRRLELYEAKKLGDAVSHIGIFWPLSSENGRNATLFISIIENDMAQSLLPLQAVGSFLPAIPSRLGRNAALDAAIASLCSIYVDHLTTTSMGSSTTIQKYIHTLSALQSCVKDPQLRSQSETICASIIVQMCELMMTRDGGQWSGLNRGCALLIKDCDPRRFVDGFDRDLLDSQRNHFLTQAMHAGEECFLARPEWRDVDRAPTEASAYGSEETRLKHMLSELLMDLPELIRESADLVMSHKARRGQQDHETRLKNAISRQLQMKQELEIWFATVSLKTGSNGVDNDEASPPKLRYRTLFCGIVDCIVNSVFVKLDRMMLCLSTLLHPNAREYKGLGWSPSFLQAIEDRRTVAREAFVFVKSTSDIGTKPLDFGLKMIATDDDVFDVPLLTGALELGS
ncbi:hypothetical protein BR93DRAFT_968924 [Coniochaeta sp. PMI_546]|nr:hypothetical protein BR93DRAFT_968924 [Coniochaeta sp. PMI_546]